MSSGQKADRPNAKQDTQRERCHCKNSMNIRNRTEVSCSNGRLPKAYAEPVIYGAGRGIWRLPPRPRAARSFHDLNLYVYLDNISYRYIH